jgi:RNA polymerase sigma-70 factor (ECF subfamily)
VEGGDLDALIARAQGGDTRAFELLLAEHLAQVRRFARAFAASEADADDLAQEALIKVYKNLRLFRYQSAFSSWLYALVRNVFLDAVKSATGRQRSLEDPLQDSHTQSLRGGEPPDESFERAQSRQRLWRALRQVSAEFRTALVLFDIEGFSYDQVAEIERVPVGTVKSRLSRGRTHLRQILKDELRLADEPGTQMAVSSSHLSRRSS